jgi:hypothetical protein
MYEILHFLDMAESYPNAFLLCRFWHKGEDSPKVEKLSNVKRYLINYPYLSDYGQTIFCLSFPSRDRATAPGRFEYIVSFLIHLKRYAIRTF